LRPKDRKMKTSVCTWSFHRAPSRHRNLHSQQSRLFALLNLSRRQISHFHASTAETLPSLYTKGVIPLFLGTLILNLLCEDVYAPIMLHQMDQAWAVQSSLKPTVLLNLRVL
jgi:hypothetical protein